MQTGKKTGIEKRRTFLTLLVRDYRENVQLRAELQREIVSVLHDQTGYPVDDGNKLSANFIYSYTTGDLFFKSILQKSFRTRQTVDHENNMLADTDRGIVRYHGSILAEVPGHEEKCVEDLSVALRELQDSILVAQVVTAYNSLANSNEKAKRSAEQLLLLNIIPGQCQICLRLGI